MKQEDLLQPSNQDAYRPLADRMRPTTLSDFFGQQHILAEGKPLRKAVESGHIHSMVLWGPPGTGKTTLARMIAQAANAQFLTLSAVLSGVKDIRAAIDKAHDYFRNTGKGTVLFVDEVHRFNKSQQDAFLPYVEDGTIVFIGATTENPSFELNNALLSRARVYVLKSLNTTEMRDIIDRALSEDQFGLQGLEFPDALRDELAHAVDGDARRALNFVEILSDLAEVNTSGRQEVTPELLAAVLEGGVRRFDKGGEAFYDQISALHKSVRGSDPDAALYWMCRMLDGGVEPLYIARRVVRMASEDIGNADPRGLELAMNAWDAMERLGSPEGELAIAQAVLYLASVPKSNAVYMAYNQAMADVKNHRSYEVPIHLRNSPTKLMKELGYGKAYRYAHDEPEGYAAGEHYFPEEMPARRYYQPVDRGLEVKIRQRLEYLRQLDAEHEQ